MKYINLFLGILLFYLFAYSMEYNRDIFTWIILLFSILNLLAFLKDEIVDEIKKIQK